MLSAQIHPRTAAHRERRKRASSPSRSSSLCLPTCVCLHRLLRIFPMINWTSDNQLGRRRPASARPARDLSLHCTRPLPARCRSRPARPRAGTAPPRAFRRYLTCLGAQGVPRWRPRARALVILVCSFTNDLKAANFVYVPRFFLFHSPFD